MFSISHFDGSTFDVTLPGDSNTKLLVTHLTMVGYIIFVLRVVLLKCSYKHSYFCCHPLITGDEASSNTKKDIKMKENVAYEVPPSRIKMAENAAYEVPPSRIKMAENVSYEVPPSRIKTSKNEAYGTVPNRP